MLALALLLGAAGCSSSGADQNCADKKPITYGTLDGGTETCLCGGTCLCIGPDGGQCGYGYR